MGVHYLWSILASAGRQLRLSDLAGKTLAVDLSGWVCQALNCHKMTRALHKPHLRNLFFRIHNLYHLGINLLFVVDGEATRMKWRTMDKRAIARGDGFVFGRSSGRRSRLQHYVSEVGHKFVYTHTYLREHKLRWSLLGLESSVVAMRENDKDMLSISYCTALVVPFSLNCYDICKYSYNKLMCYLYYLTNAQIPCTVFF